MIIDTDALVHALLDALGRAKHVAFDAETQNEVEGGGTGADSISVGCSLAWVVPDGEPDSFADIDPSPFRDEERKLTIHAVYVPVRHLTPQLRIRISKKKPKQPIPSDAPCVSTGDTTYAVGPERVSNVRPEFIYAALGKVFSRQDLCLVMHNAKFDLHILRNEGVDVDGVTEHLEDTMLMNFILDATTGGNGLKFLVKSIFDHEMTQISQFKIYCGNERSPVPSMGKYAADDALQTLRLYFHLKDALDKKGNEMLRKAYYSLEIPICRLVENMENKGLFIDIPYLERVRDELIEKEKAVEKSIVEMLAGLAGQDQVKLSSTVWLSDMLIDAWGLWAPIKERGMNKRYSTDAEYLSLVVSGAVPGCTELGIRVAKEMLWLRKLTKIRGTYTDSVLKKISPVDGRLHGSFNQMGAATGRFSSSEPNLQNIPRSDSRLPDIRKAFIAPPGCVLVDADYSQIELRILAHFSGDPVMLDIYRQSGDIHAITAKLVGCTRQQAKPINFGVIYGQQAWTLAETLDVSEKEAEGFLKAFFAGYPMVKPFINQSVSFLRKNGFVSTLIGRRRPISGYNSDDRGKRSHAERQAVNTRIQGSASDLMKIAMRNVFNRLTRENLREKVSIISQVHDELIIEAKEDVAEYAKDLVKYEMENAVSLLVPLVSEPHIAKSWSEAK